MELEVEIELERVRGVVTLIFTAESILKLAAFGCRVTPVKPFYVVTSKYLKLSKLIIGFVCSCCKMLGRSVVKFKFDYSSHFSLAELGCWRVFFETWVKLNVILLCETN